MKLSLTRQALILISVPLCFEIACVGMLVYTQREADIEAARATKARKIADCITRLNNEFYKSWEVVQNFKANWLRHHTIDLSFKNALSNIGVQYKELISLTDDQKALQSHIYLSMRQLEEGERIVAQAVSDIETGNIDDVMRTHVAKMARLKEMFRTCMSHELVIFAQHEKAVADSSNGRQAALREQIAVYSILAVLFSIVFSVFVAAFVVKRITSRISVVNENARKLASSQPLSPPMGGTDEIAELDSVFHKMADEIEETARTKQELVNMLTHDLRTPLTSIQGCFTMLDEGMLGTLNERGESMVRLADRNSLRMMNLINDLLDVQKIKSGMMTIETSDVELFEVLEEVRLNFVDWMKEHDLKMEICDTDLCVKADHEKLGRVFFNLVGNAFKASPKGGTITLSAKKTDGFAQISVSDQGRGISKEMQQSIFERFQQGDKDSKTGGSGLGLTICHSIVTLHGGKIWVESELDKGSSFIFTIPLSDSSS